MDSSGHLSVNCVTLFNQSVEGNLIIATFINKINLIREPAGPELCISILFLCVCLYVCVCVCVNMLCICEHMRMYASMFQFMDEL